MKAQDWMDQHNERAEMVRQIMAYCDSRDFSYKITQKEFKIQLPQVEPLPVTNQIRTAKNERPNFKFLEADPNGIDETEDEDLPPVDTTLEEGTPPEETK